MMLANGTVLGFMHGDLPVSLRPASRSWQSGTLLVACGCAMYAVQPLLPLPVMVTVSNGLILLGLTAYCRALYAFYERSPRAWLPLPAILGVLGVFWFSAVQPNTEIRIVLISAAWLVLMGNSVLILKRGARRDDALSRRMLLAIFAGVFLFTALRLLHYVRLGMAADFSIATDASWMNLATPMLGAALPVIGTTAFVLMCSERIRRQWERAASTDYLTDLPNRRTLTQAGVERFKAARAREEGFAIAVIDIDRFKTINDQYGHETGDIALKHVGARLKSAIRDVDLVARTGGEEFVVLFDRVGPEEVEAAAERLRSAVRLHSFTAGTVKISITVSVGVAICRGEDADFNALLRRADEALYAAKSAGRNQVKLAA
ncbi:GGDEF domain-containing protein [Bosea rubneri]|uniref:diguanylate cyclase n=1 Tax=Bosea rubneri TaxID=3075434 RepID=A0ABU3S5J1_9HYPH|nr:GGDEF domain-containing protein [Bosea sp. ZW T0_25]MDU0340051.1 GGDEF domain-containing protein [Bosea sp. ZW T0_25]